MSTYNFEPSLKYTCFQKIAGKENVLSPYHIDFFTVSYFSQEFTVSSFAVTISTLLKMQTYVIFAPFPYFIRVTSKNFLFIWIYFFCTLMYFSFKWICSVIKCFFLVGQSQNNVQYVNKV